MKEQLQAMLAKIPLVPILVLYGCYMGWSYYSFTTDPSSPLLQRVASLQQVQQQNTAARVKLKKAQEFYQTLQQRRAELRALALQLEEVKASLSEEIDVSAFIRTVVAEAKKVGMTVLEIKPTDLREHEYYDEQAFDFKFRGVFVQLRVFLQRLTELDRIMRVGNLSIEPVSTSDSEYVVLDGDMELDAYRYRGSHADEVGKADGAAPANGVGGSR